MKKTIIITGANKGIGLEIARQLGKSGHRIILSARNEINMNEAVQKLEQEQIEVTGLLMDIADELSIGKAADEFAKLNLKADVLINNAAVMLKGDRSLLQLNEAVLLQTITTNCYGALRVVKAFLPLMNSPQELSTYRAAVVQ